MRITLLAALGFLLPALANAQAVRVRGGPTLGVTTPGWGRYSELFDTRPVGYQEERQTPLVSPVVGASAFVTFRKHWAVDAAIQWHRTGYRFTAYHAYDNFTGEHEERMRLHRLSLPVTLGYAFNAWRVPVRVGAGATFYHFLSGRFNQEIQLVRDGKPEPLRQLDVNPFEQNSRYRLGFLHWGAGRQTYYTVGRLSVSVAPSERLMIGISASPGVDMTLWKYVTEEWSQVSGANFRSDAFDFTATYLLK